jgi:hypothetical protein
MIESDNRIKAVMVGAVSGKQKLLERFRRKGWKEMAEFKNTLHGTTVVIMKRPLAAPVSPAKISGQS